MPPCWQVSFAVMESADTSEQELSAKNCTVARANESSQNGFHGLSAFVLDGVDNVLVEGQFSDVHGR